MAKVVKDYLTTTEALELAEGRGISMSLPTLTNLCKVKGLGKQTAGKGTKWLVYTKRFTNFLNQCDS